MTEHEVKEWLKRGYNAYRETKSLETLLTAFRMHAEGLDRSGEHNYTGRSDTHLNGTENAFLKLADIERKYKECQQKLSDISGEIFRAVSLLNDNELEIIMIHRYLYFRTIEQTAELMNYSPSTIKNRQNQAIKKLCPLLSCVALSDVIE